MYHLPELIEIYVLSIIVVMLNKTVCEFDYFVLMNTPVKGERRRKESNNMHTN